MFSNEGTPQTVLVTGAAGFGASGLIRALLGRGYRVTGLDQVAPAHAELLDGIHQHPDFCYVWKNLQDVVPRDIHGHDIVVHLAAQADVPMGFDSPRFTAMQNIDGTVALLEAVRRENCVTRLIYAGSGNEIGRPLYLPIDEAHPLTPHNPYAFSKAAAELAVWAWHRAYGVPGVVMSNGAVIGPNMRREIFIFKWLWNALQGLPIVLEGGDQTRDVTYVSDVVDAWLLAIEAPGESVVGQKFQVSFGQEISVRDLAHMCLEAAGSDVPIRQADYRPGERGQRECFSNARAREVLGYSPQVGPRQAIEITADWVRNLLAERAAGSGRHD